jgi:carboxypeptidase C (cathepsin A)
MSAICFLGAQEKLVDTTNSIQINGQIINYKATAGTIELKDDSDKPTANMFYVAYTKVGDMPLTKRPITYCFNGGPGCPSIWLHMGAFGPKRVTAHGVEDNEYSLLDLTDLVFIDPVSTGYSRAASGVDPKQFYGYESDVASVAKFIRIYTTRFNRWLSPKFVAGESYGTTRAVGVANRLQNEVELAVSGVILISTVLNWGIDFTEGNDLPYPLYLPSYTAAAWYHKKLSKDLLVGDLMSALKESEDFALGEYASALILGDALPKDQKKMIVEKLSRLTGMETEDVNRENLRMTDQYFVGNLLRDENRVIGVLDTRAKGIELNSPDSYTDPSLDFTFSEGFNSYVRTTLKYETDQEYVLSADVDPWDYSKNKALNVSGELREAMSVNPSMRVFAASGYFDLATPYRSVDYTINHLDLDPSIKSHLIQKYYHAGHMIYNDRPSAKKLKEDLTKFYDGFSSPFTKQ